MNRKILGLILAGILTMGVTGCSGSKEESGANNNKTNIEDSTKKDIPEGLNKELGNGSVILSIPRGTTENENIPVLCIAKDTQLDQIGLDSENFDGSKLSYIYIDGMLNVKEQLGEMSQTTITLQDKALKEGKHKVEIVQYDNNEQTGTPVTYKVVSYEVKNK